MDRLTPALRPKDRARGTQKWKHLLFLHWEVDARRLRELVPEPLELDLLDGKALIGLVPFAMEEVRPWFAPRWMGFDFLETNVRTYVHYNGVPGVFFFSLDAASWLGVQVARIGWGLPYFYASMRMNVEGSRFIYDMTRREGDRPRLALEATIGEELGASAPGTDEHFLLERYFLFVRRGQRLVRGQVHHVPYPAHRAELLRIDDGVIQAAGFDVPSSQPLFTHYSPGVDVEVFSLEEVWRSG